MLSPNELSVGGYLISTLYPECSDSYFSGATNLNQPLSEYSWGNLFSLIVTLWTLSFASLVISVLVIGLLIKSCRLKEGAGPYVLIIA